MSVLVDRIPSARAQPMLGPTKPSHTMNDGRHLHWPVLGVALALLASLAWNGSLAWIVGRSIGIW